MITKHDSKAATRRRTTHWAWLLPVLALSPLLLAAKGCTNAGVVGDDCPTADACTPGTAGTGGDVPTQKICGGLQGLSCADGFYCSFPPSAQCGAADQTGTCKAMPSACDLVYAPVCGCDDKTYGNDCEAASNGVSVAAQGACESDPDPGPEPGTGDCGGLAGLTCAADEYCQFDAGAQCGAADQLGKCQPKPQTCDQIYAPVCGCDDKTYGNECMAAAAGVSVAAVGECEVPTGVVCGARAGDTCADGQYCLYKPGDLCGRADATGTCTDIPDGGCITLYDPVCGCDGKTYGNDCEAGLAGVAVDHAGECEPPSGEICGGIANAGCQDDYYCDYSGLETCGTAGVCRKKPDVCPENIAWVCGCDGKSYSNACVAAQAEVTVASQGKCP